MSNEFEKLPPEEAIVMVADLGGYFKFSSQPDVQQYVWDYILFVTDCIETTIRGGKAFWLSAKPVYKPFPDPVFVRYLGDGGMYVWREEQFAGIDRIRLPNRLRSLTKHFDRVNHHAAHRVPGVALPKQLRISIAKGTILPATPDRKRLIFSHTKEIECTCRVLGVAEKLQMYCRDLSFIGSKRLGVSEKLLLKHGYKSVVATKLPDRAGEEVFVDKVEFRNLDVEKRNHLFSVRHVVRI